MTNEQEKARQLAGLLTAFADGKQLHSMAISDSNCQPMEWHDIDVQMTSTLLNLLIDKNYLIRIKPERKIVNLTQQDLIDRELSGKTISVIYNKMVSHILRYSDSKIYFSEKEIRDYEYLTDFTFIDGTPCYKEVESE